MTVISEPLFTVISEPLLTVISEPLLRSRSARAGPRRTAPHIAASGGASCHTAWLQGGSRDAARRVCELYWRGAVLARSWFRATTASEPVHAARRFSVQRIGRCASRATADCLGGRVLATGEGGGCVACEKRTVRWCGNRAPCLQRDGSASKARKSQMTGGDPLSASARMLAVAVSYSSAARLLSNLTQTCRITKP